MSRCELCEIGLDEADVGRMLCAGCEKTTGQRLAAFPWLYTDLAEFLPRSAGATGDGPGGTTVDPPLPLTEAPFVLRGPGGMVGILEDWRATVHTERKFGPPVLAGDIERRVAAAVKALTASLPWIAGSWPLAGTFAGEIHDLYRDVTSITAPPEPRGTRVGNCPAAQDGEPCGAALYLPPGERVITCSWCRTSYPPAMWNALRALQELEAAS